MGGTHSSRIAACKFASTPCQSTARSRPCASFEKSSSARRNCECTDPGSYRSDHPPATAGCSSRSPGPMDRLAANASALLLGPKRRPARQVPARLTVG